VTGFARSLKREVTFKGLGPNKREMKKVGNEKDVEMEGTDYLLFAFFFFPKAENDICIVIVS